MYTFIRDALVVLWEHQTSLEQKVRTMKHYEDQSNIMDILFVAIHNLWNILTHMQMQYITLWCTIGYRHVNIGFIDLFAQDDWSSPAIGRHVSQSALSIYN